VAAWLLRLPLMRDCATHTYMPAGVVASHLSIFTHALA
jgi:hypothetical protein